MRDDRATWTAALEPARRTAYAPGQYVGQESFMSAREILSLARRAGIGPADTVLDVCCGVAGPGRLVTAARGCHYLGVDRSAAAVALARRAVGDLPCRFEVAEVPPVPPGPFDVVLLLETLLAFRHKGPLLAAVAAALRPGGRLVVTVEEGPSLSSAEQAAMPASDTVWPVRLAELRTCLARVGLEVASVEEHTTAHRATAEALADAFVADRRAIAARIGPQAVDDLVTGHRLWARWLRVGRIRKLGVVAVRSSEPPGPTSRSPG
ncbi:class I SAM-dependent methyltransferase [Nocardioides sp. GXQ0305]|uniref:class I SAM-dependent methyltransferase n=1 Tax=Nocardioides sp. GXQ0305 TaxID=3423912 RepID=UPI003D7CF555